MYMTVIFKHELHVRYTGFSKKQGLSPRSDKKIGWMSYRPADLCHILILQWGGGGGLNFTLEYMEKSCKEANINLTFESVLLK